MYQVKNDNGSLSVDIDEFITESYYEYGSYIAKNRVIPGVDGLKPVARRTLMALSDIAVGKLVGTVNAIGQTIIYHPFNPTSVENVIADMARRGSISSQGQFGVKLLDNSQVHAAPRYTKVGLSKDQYKWYFSLTEKYAAKVEGEDRLEYKYLITPIPDSLIYGTMSWGLGLNVRTPPFTMKSLWEAWRQNDYRKLVLNYGYKFTNKEGLESLWLTGKGRIGIGLDVDRVNKNTIYIKGSGELIKPKLKMLSKYVEQGKISIFNESTDMLELRIEKVPNIRFDMDEIYDICLKACTVDREYDIKIFYEDRIFTIGIKDWLDITIGNYIKFYDKYKEDRINKLKQDIALYEYLPKVAPLILKNVDDATIMEKTGCPKYIYDRVLRLQISYLRDSDRSKEISLLKDTIESINKEDSIKVIDDMVKNLSKVRV